MLTGCGDVAVAGLPRLEIGDRSLCLIIGIELFAGALIVSFVTVSAAGSGLTGNMSQSTKMASEIFSADVALVVVVGITAICGLVTGFFGTYVLISVMLC